VAGFPEDSCAGAPRGGLKKALVALCTVALGLVGLVVVAPTAFAHHAVLSASASCPAPFAANTYTVHYTSNSWTTGAGGANAGMFIEYRLNGGTWVTGPSYVFPNQATVPSVSGTFDVSSASPITSLAVRTNTNAAWGNGNTVPGPWPSAAGVPVALPTGCQPPGQPGATVADSCAQGGFVVSVSNTGGAAVTFTVAAPAVAGGSAAFSQNPVVAGGTSASVLVPFAENETRTITVSSTEPAFNQTFTRTLDCRHGAAHATIINECASVNGATGVMVEVTNTGDDSVSATVNGNPAQAVAAGGSVSVFVAVTNGAAFSIGVVVDGKTLTTLTGTRRCDQGTATIEQACASQEGQTGVTVHVTNTGDNPLSVTFNGGTLHSVAVGGDIHVFVAVAENAPYTIVLAGNGHTLATLTGDRDCDHGAGSAAVTSVCATQDGQTGVTVTVGNSGTDSVSASVNGTPAHNVPAGGHLDVFVPVAENAGFSIGVSFDGHPGPTLTGTRDCAKPAVIAGQFNACAEGGIGYTLDNSTGTDTAFFAVTTPSGATMHSVAGGQKTAVTIPAGEGTSTHITVTWGPTQATATANALADTTIVRNCTSVLTETVTRTPTPAAAPARAVAVAGNRLARTGAQTGLLAEAGALLAIAGVAMLAVRRRMSPVSGE
jgi:hypothetical protein